MSIYPENLSELADMFPSEEACLEYLSAIRWPDGYQCLRCTDKNALKIGRGLYRCRSCKYEGSVISGTLFQDTHKPLRLWFQAMWYVVGQKNGVSALGRNSPGSIHDLSGKLRIMSYPGADITLLLIIRKVFNMGFSCTSKIDNTATKKRHKIARTTCFPSFFAEGRIGNSA